MMTNLSPSRFFKIEGMSEKWFGSKSMFPAFIPFLSIPDKKIEIWRNFDFSTSTVGKLGSIRYKELPSNVSISRMASNNAGGSPGIIGKTIASPGSITLTASFADLIFSLYKLS